MNEQLKKYIEESVLPIYEHNDAGHNIDHINYVIERSIRFAKTITDIDMNMVYTIAAYHDIGHHIDAKNHEKVSAQMLLQDQGLKEYFSEEEIKIMADAVYEHRASLEGEPRNIYGKIVSSADRNTNIELPLKRTYSYRLKNDPESTIEEIIEESRQHLLNKFGNKGYATDKMYFEDLEYKQFLIDITSLASSPKKFRERFIELNELDIPVQNKE